MAKLIVNAHAADFRPTWKTTLDGVDITDICWYSEIDNEDDMLAVVYVKDEKGGYVLSRDSQGHVNGVEMKVLHGKGTSVHTPIDGWELPTDVSYLAGE